MKPIRPVAGVLDAPYTLEGAGFGVYRPFPQPSLSLLDPFLLLDEMEPTEHAPGAAQGAPDHPHRGFETVTYVLEGEVEHADSKGNRDVIGPGDVQWMTAGSGVVHSEMPSARLQTEGGRVHGFQLWVNLPAAAKMIDPTYQSIRAADIPRLEGDGWVARIVAGTVAGTTGPASTRTPIGYAHVTIEPGSTMTLDVPADHRAAAYVFAGRAITSDRTADGTTDGTVVEARRLVVYDIADGAIQLQVGRGEPAVEALVLSGRPLDEPVARHGPFVMNTRQQLIEAFDDYQSGRMGRIEASDATA
ncbi:MAG: pirin family protein [Acidimicrobiales bacterium]